MEDYAAKMALKPDAALREYASNYAQYREEAVLAALDELRRRGQPVPDEAALRPQLEAVVQQAQAAKAEQAATTAAAPATTDAEGPPLYTPGVIVLVSVLFNTIITGAVLLAINLHQLKRTQAIWRLLGFVLLYLLAESMVMGQLMRHGLFSPLLVSLLNLPAILAYVLWFWPRYVGIYQFPSRGWLVPVLVCFACAAALGYYLSHTSAFAPYMKQLQQMQQ